METLVRARFLVVALGVILVAVGFFAREINEEYTAFTHETIVGASGSVGVYEPDREGDWPIWQVEFDEAAGDRGLVYRLDEEGAEPLLVFSGTRDEATAWASTRGRTPLFEGTRSEVTAWIDTQERSAESTWVPTGLMVTGAVVALFGLSLRWGRARQRV